MQSKPFFCKKKKGMIYQMTQRFPINIYKYGKA